uniref:Putative neurofilament heavy polypeptide-like n=1 Tax=Davidia involucrata TaxID=16924 RepID=A0A5B6ZN10_DAVIN
MASEAVVSDHSTTPEQVEKKANEEVKTIEHESVSPSKESGEEEKSKAEESPSPVAPIAESEEKIEDKPVEPPVVEEVKKTVDVSVEDNLKVAPDSIPELAIESVEKQPVDVPKSSVEAVCEKEEQVEVLPVKESEAVVAKEVESSEVESKKEEIPESEEQVKTVDVSESSVEAAEKKEEQVEVLPVKESEVVVVKGVENSEAESKKEETPEPVPEVEKSEVAELVEKECAEVEPKESVEVEIVKDEATLTDKVEDTELLKEVQTTKEESPVTESSDQVTSTYEEAQVEIKEDRVECPPDVAENKEKELIATNVVEGLSKEEVVELGKTEVENEAKDVKTEEDIGEKRITEELNQPETNKVEDVSSSISTTEVIEKSLEGENTSRGIELIAENGKESIKDETVTSLETSKDREAEEKVDEVTTATAKEQAEEPQESEREVKGEESVQTGETNLVKEKEAGGIAKPDFPNPESTKDGDDTKTSQDPLKGEVAAKSIQKQSNNIIAKVKQSLVKAKKAILGKSANSKSLSSETKGEVKVK